MQAFSFYSPTEVVFGRDTENKTGELVRKYRGSRVFVVYGGGSVVRSGLLDRVTAALDAAGLAWQTFGGAKPNPTLSHAREGVAKAVEFQADFVLAVGGGSAIDTAKGIAHGIANPGVDIWKFWTREQPLSASTPVGVILTIPAAGSEMSNSAVLTDKSASRKRGLSTDLNRPRFAILNPELTYTLPKYQLACGITDIMMHTMERYFSLTENELTDAIAEALLRTVIENGRIAMHTENDYEAMSELMWAGSLSHNGLTGLGHAGDWAVHQLGHELSARYDVAHGASLAAVWGSWARYVCDAKPSRFARFARNVWGITEPEDNAAAQAGIAATEAYFASIGMPTNLAACLGSGTVALHDELAYGCSYEETRTIGTFKVLTMADMAKIYAAAAAKTDSL